MQAFGATAVPMGLAEMITSLQSGVIDGTMSGISIYVNFNLQTVSKTITETNDTLLVSFGALSKNWLNGLPADLRKTVVDEARALQSWAIKQSDDEKIALRQKWIDRGGEIINLPAEDMAELQKRLRPIGAEITKSDPALKAFYEKVLATAAKY
jgi:C4-dicarboxylate-binding protein DctP